MDREVMEHYGWLIVVLIVGLSMIIMTSPVSNYIYANIKADTVKQIMDNRDIDATNNNISTSVKQYNIIYNTDGGKWEGPHITKYVKGKNTELPTNIYKEGYEFAGWYTDDTYTTRVSITSTHEGEITVYAKWVGQKYLISYNLNGGIFNDINDATFYYRTGETIDLTTNISKDGHTFKQWILAETQTPITKIEPTMTNDITIIAEWDKN